MELVIGLILFCSIVTSVYLNFTLNNKAYKAIDSFNIELEKTVLFKPQVKYNNKLYLMDKIKRWNDDNEAGNWLVMEQSQGDIITEFTVDNQKFIAIYKLADDIED